MGPKFLLKLTPFAQFARLAEFLNLAVPFVRTFKYFENRRQWRVFNLYDAYLNGKEGERGHCMLVEPANGREVLIPKTFGDPHNDLGF